MKKIVTLNLPQMMVQMVQANSTLLLWGRGTGKTVGGIGPWMARVAEAMPGHLSGLFGKDYETLEKNILPKFIQGMEMVGYYRDQHYVIGKRPPASWPNCLYSLKKWDKTIAWHNGTVFQEVSLFNRGSANAFDFQSGVFDEVKFMDKNQLEDEVYPTFRGFDKLFGHKPEYLSKIYATDKYGDYLELKWILDMRKKVDQKKVETVIRLQLHLTDLYNALPTAGRNKKKVESYIRHIRQRLQLLRKDLLYVSEASAVENQENLGAKWLADKKRTMSSYEFDVAIMNDDPIRSENSFYPSLSNTNLYNHERGSDYNPHKPFYISMDYQHSVSPMCVVQDDKIIGEDRPTINFSNEFYTLHPKGLKECIDLFCDTYAGHLNKMVYYIYDHTAVGERQSAQRYKDIVVTHFRSKGWNVIECYTGVPPEHYLKFEKMKAWMEGTDEQSKLIRFNADKCPKTLISMQASGAITERGKTKKDKKYELTHRYPSIDQSETTHFSDCVDQLLWYFFTIHKAVAQGGGIAVR
jgi:hypothetical protein